MKKVLIATTNKDKFSVVSKILEKTIFPKDKYEIMALTTDMNIPDEKEVGSNIERARSKAINAYTHLKGYNFDYIVGLDDAIFIKGTLQPNVKEYISKILFDNYLSVGERYEFNRAYCIIDKDGKMYETSIGVPYEYKPLDHSVNLKEYSYPLSMVSCPIGKNIAVSDLSEEESTEYFLKYIKDDIMKLDIGR